MSCHDICLGSGDIHRDIITFATENVETSSQGNRANTHFTRTCTGLYKTIPAVVGRIYCNTARALLTRHMHDVVIYVSLTVQSCENGGSE
jgi:hypothetical protein